MQDELDDARATIELLFRMQIEQENLDRYGNLFGYHPKYGFSGQRISSVTYRPRPFDSLSGSMKRTEM